MSRAKRGPFFEASKDELLKMVGKYIVKISGKPFQSGEPTGLVKAITEHSRNPKGRLAFVVDNEPEDCAIDVRSCRPVNFTDRVPVQLPIDIERLLKTIGEVAYGHSDPNILVQNLLKELDLEETGGRFW